MSEHGRPNFACINRGLDPKEWCHACSTDPILTCKRCGCSEHDGTCEQMDLQIVEVSMDLKAGVKR